MELGLKITSLDCEVNFAKQQNSCVVIVVVNSQRFLIYFMTVNANVSVLRSLWYCCGFRGLWNTLPVHSDIGWRRISVCCSVDSLLSFMTFFESQKVGKSMFISLRTIGNITDLYKLAKYIVHGPQKVVFETEKRRRGPGKGKYCSHLFNSFF